MKILDAWKVHAGTSDLQQPSEGVPVSQIIINSNYSDDQDDYDIALMKLSRPLSLSGDSPSHTQGRSRALWLSRDSLLPLLQLRSVQLAYPCLARSSSQRGPASSPALARLVRMKVQ